MKQNSLRQAREFSNSQILDKKDKSRILEFKNFILYRHERRKNSLILKFLIKKISQEF